jgi:glycosyltransferase involved in cell wall biosynthesis
MFSPTLTTEMTQGPALVCFSHLRWNFVYQRPQHLLSRAAKGSQVFFFEEPLFHDAPAGLVRVQTDCGVEVLVPHLPANQAKEITKSHLRELLDGFLESQQFSDLTFWYYTPMALAFSDHIEPDYCVYDCMDELSAFRFAPPELIGREKQLLNRCDIVFTGGQSLFEAKQHCHHNMHCFPSSIDKEHFARARSLMAEIQPADQASIAEPRVGFFGVIDERMDLQLVASLAETMPDVQIIMLGPLAKVDATDLPRAANLHWLGHKSYDELPCYLAGWQCGIMPFAINESTRFISPTKTPEYLAAGLPLVSTPIKDVTSPYGDLGLVTIARTPAQFAEAVLRELRSSRNAERIAQADQYLADKSWDRTFSEMRVVMKREPCIATAVKQRSLEPLEQVTL